MSAPTPSLADLLPLCDRASFTPGRKAFPALVEGLTSADPQVRRSVERALLRAGEAGEAAVRRALAGADGPARGRVAEGLARFASSDIGAARATLIDALDDPDPRTRRVAAQAAGQWPALDPTTEARLEGRLIAQWPEADLPSRRVIARTLGRLGGPRAEALLSETLPEDPALRRLAAEALTLLRRRGSRGEASAVTGHRPPPASIVVRVRCRPGLEGLLRDELDALRLHEGTLALTRGAVTLRTRRPLTDLFASRLMVDLTLPLPAVPLGTEGPGQALAHALSAGPPRYRIAWAGPGKQRAETRVTVAALSALAPELVNDPSERTWEVEARVLAESGRLAPSLTPRLIDPRYPWRVADIPAASHPTLAAALVRVGGHHPGDMVWDPFVGSGLELIERALAGPARRLIGTDVSARALSAARANLDAAGVKADLHRARAEQFSPGQVDLILTNAPLGSRSLDDAGVRALMQAFIPKVAEVLSPRGRMAWLTQNPAKSDPLLTAAGLRVVFSQGVNLSGLRATIQRVERA